MHYYRVLQFVDVRVLQILNVLVHTIHFLYNVLHEIEYLHVLQKFTPTFECIPYMGVCYFMKHAFHMSQENLKVK